MNVKGYKVFNSDWTCRGFHYEVGKTYEMDESPIICERGFHFCKNLRDCFYYYSFDGAKIAEVTALGEINQMVDEVGDTAGAGTIAQKFCTNKIRIDREIPWKEITVEENARSYMTDKVLNTGYRNYGLDNTGRYNWGNWNTGSGNVGDYNSGNRNLGEYNTGHENIGDCNSGSYNFGDLNVGKSNCGNRNYGDYNIGYDNFGDFNRCDCSTGCFCTTLVTCRTDFDDEIPTRARGNIRFFNKASGWDYFDWHTSDVYMVLRKMPTYVCRCFRKYPEEFDQEQFDKSSWEGAKTAISVMGGMYVDANVREGNVPVNINVSVLPNDADVAITRQKWWDGLTKRQRKLVYDLPNFDPAIFEECTLIKVNLEEWRELKDVSLSYFDNEGKELSLGSDNDVSFDW